MNLNNVHVKTINYQEAELFYQSEIKYKYRFQQY